MKLCIAEKPSVARDLAEILGATNRREGYLEGNGYCVTWVFGHLCSLKDPEDYNSNWKYWRLEDLPIIPPQFGIKLKNDAGAKKQFKIIEQLVAQAEEVINCGDAGQEGELIQRWVLIKAKCKVPVKRLWISSLTEEAIKEGFKKLKDAKDFDNLFAAGNSRAVGDWILGINGTRLYTKKYGKDKMTLSVGRVQTPTLAMIVLRQKEINAFKTSEYWELKTMYRKTEFLCQIERLRSEEKAIKGLEYIENKPFEITSFEQKEGKEGQPRLFDLTSLQVDGNKIYSFSAEETLNIIQSLYEKKLVSYPRVDTTYLSDDIHPKIPGIMNGLKDYQRFTASILAKAIPKSKTIFDNAKITDHHAIIPTGIQANSLNENEKKIYDLIARRFIAAFYPECLVSNTTVLGKVDQLVFKASGKQIINKGWRVVYDDLKGEVDPEVKVEKKETKDTILPIFEKGESGEHKPVIHKGKTSPPKHYTEATLLRAMESAGKLVDNEEMRELMKENGIGRPSTRANIIETLFKRKYIEKKKKNILATETGMSLIDLIKSDLLKSPELTGQWEHKLRLIEKGTYDPQTFKDELFKMVRELSDEVIFN
jgi:DNA topoisomerase-3